MNEQPIIFVAFEEQDNLGVGYMASVLMEQGFSVRIIDFRIGKEAILSSLLEFDPLVVGFSVIFQHHIERFQELIRFLRDGGVDCHFAAGGHYPSLRCEQLLQLIPEIDSVVLFEGEITFLELVRALAAGGDWKQVQGIAYWAGAGVVVTPLRPLEQDLDRFPPPVRMPLRNLAFDKKFATLLAGRGCWYHCSFCSIQEFYAAPPGPVKRVRSAEMVVQEMALLHRQKDCSIFMFQDDDFPITYRKGAWLDSFCHQLEETGLRGKVLWKINCRPDEVSRTTFAKLKEYGLFLVYLGIEAGTDEGLRRMDKHTTVATNLQATTILKELDIVFDYGFMLFDPSSTFASIATNLDFLDRLCADGSTPITFCKMLPYAGTKVEKQLLAEGRLRGAPGHEDYNFHDPELDQLYLLMANSFADWIGDQDGLLNLARWIRHYIAIYRHYFPVTPEFTALAAAARATIAESNQRFTGLVRRMAKLCSPAGNDAAQLSAASLQREAQTLHDCYRDKLDRIMTAIERAGEASAYGV